MAYLEDFEQVNRMLYFENYEKKSAGRGAFCRARCRQGGRMRTPLDMMDRKTKRAYTAPSPVVVYFIPIEVENE